MTCNHDEHDTACIHCGDCRCDRATDVDTWLDAGIAEVRADCPLHGTPEIGGVVDLSWSPAGSSEPLVSHVAVYDATRVAAVRRLVQAVQPLVDELRAAYHAVADMIDEGSDG